MLARTFAASVLVLLAACTRPALDDREDVPSTFSIAAVDTQTGEIGIAVQSKFIAVGSVIGFTFVMSWIIAKAVDATVGPRCTEEEELEGLDLSQHAEAAYAFGELGSIGRV